MTTKTPARTVGVLGGALLGVIAGLAAPTTAFAAPDAPSGQYHVTYNDPDVPDETWTFSPCGANCALARNDDEAKTPTGWEFHLSNGQWAYHDEQPFDCTVPGAEPQQKLALDVSFDAATLSGHWRTGPSGDCGPRYEHEDLALQLTKAG